MKRKSKFVCLLCTIIIIGFRLPDPLDAPVHTIYQSPTTVQSLSADIYRQYLTAHKILDSTQSPEAAVVKRISDRVINAVKNQYNTKKSIKELDGFNWEVKLVHNTKVDAWCLPGGKIVVYSSLLPLTQSDASMAVVLSHEIAHVLLKHGDVRMKQYLKEYLGGKSLDLALSAKTIETKDFFRMAYGNGDYFGPIRAFSSADEIEADKLGAVFCALAGYDPTESIVFWERMNKLNGTGRQPEIISTHPVDTKRVSQLKEIMEETVKNYYKPIRKN